MKKTYIYIFMLIILGCFIRCIDENIIDCPNDKKQTLVRIQATISSSFGELSTRNVASTRSDIIENDEDYIEYEEVGSTDENAIGTIRVVAMSPNTGEVVKNILFDNITPQPDGTIQLDLSIWAGSYRFLLLANEVDDMSAMNNYSELTDLTNGIPNELSTEEELTELVNNNSGMFMIGEAIIEVKPNRDATANNPQVVSPKIELKRVLAKVEVNIRNTDDNDNVFHTAQEYKITKVSLGKYTTMYMPLENSNELADAGDEVIENHINHDFGKPFNDNILKNYIPEQKGIEEAKPISVEISVATKSGETFTYDIPLFQYEADKKTKNYDIRRNTIYRLNTRLIGKEIKYELEVYTAIEGWTPVEIGVLELPPVDYLNVDTKTIYLGASPAADTTAKIYYVSNLDYIGFKTDIQGLYLNNNGDHLEISIPKITSGSSMPLTLKFGRNGKVALNTIIMVKAIDRP